MSSVTFETFIIFKLYCLNLFATLCRKSLFKLFYFMIYFCSSRECFWLLFAVSVNYCRLDLQVPVYCVNVLLRLTRISLTIAVCISLKTVLHHKIPPSSICSDGLRSCEFFNSLTSTAVRISALYSLNEFQDSLFARHLSYGSWSYHHFCDGQRCNQYRFI